MRTHGCTAEEEKTILNKNKVCLSLPRIFSLNYTQKPSDQFIWNELLILISLNHRIISLNRGNVFALKINTLTSVSLACTLLFHEYKIHMLMSKKKKNTIERQRNAFSSFLSPHIISDHCSIFLKWEDTRFHLCYNKNLCQHKILSLL